MRLLPRNWASSERTSENATLKCTGVTAAAAGQAEPVVPINALYTGTGKPAVAVSQMKDTRLDPAVLHALVGSSNVAFPLDDVPKKSRCPTIESAAKYTQIFVGVVSLSHAIQVLAASDGRFGEVKVVRLSTAFTLAVQNRCPQSGPLPEIGSPLIAARAEAPKNPDDPTATTGMLCALPAGTQTAAIASANNPLQIFHSFINLLLLDIFRFKSFSLTPSRLPRGEPELFGQRPQCSPRIRGKSSRQVGWTRFSPYTRLSSTPLKVCTEFQTDGNWIGTFEGFRDTAFVRVGWKPSAALILFANC
jgi:hypothetical protein